MLSAGVHSAYQNYEADPELAGGSYSIKNAADSAGFYNDIMVDSLSRLVHLFVCLFACLLVSLLVCDFVVEWDGLRPSIGNGLELGVCILILLLRH